MDWIDQARKKREMDNVIKYGPIKPKTDPRCFRREMLEELLDALNYAQWAYQKGEITKRQYQWIDRGTRAVVKVIQNACADKFAWELSWIKR